MPGELRTASEAALGAATTLLGDAAPTRVYVSNGIPAVDCEQLVIYAEAVNLVAANAPTIGTAIDPRVVRVHIATLVLQRWAPACNPPEAPPTDVLELEAALVDEEGWEVWCRLPGVLGDIDNLTLRGMLSLSPAVASGTLGDYVGWQVRFSVEVPGWRPAG